MNNIKVFMLIMAILSLAACSEPPVLADLFPGQIGEMRLEKMITGQQAIESVDKLHGKSIPAQDAAIAKYTGTDSAMIWISRTKNGAEAREQTALMVEKMVRTPGTPFSGHERSMVKGAEVHRFEGMGQVHLTFFKGDLVYWISVDLGSEQTALDAFLQ